MSILFFVCFCFAVELRLSNENIRRKTIGVYSSRLPSVRSLICGSAHIAVWCAEKSVHNFAVFVLFFFFQSDIKS